MLSKNQNEIASLAHLQTFCMLLFRKAPECLYHQCHQDNSLESSLQIMLNGLSMFGYMQVFS